MCVPLQHLPISKHPVVDIVPLPSRMNLISITSGKKQQKANVVTNHSSSIGRSSNHGTFFKKIIINKVDRHLCNSFIRPIQMSLFIGGEEVLH